MTATTTGRPTATAKPTSNRRPPKTGHPAADRTVREAAVKATAHLGHGPGECSGGAEAHEEHLATNGECPWDAKPATLRFSVVTGEHAGKPAWFLHDAEKADVVGRYVSKEKAELMASQRNARVNGETPAKPATATKPAAAKRGAKPAAKPLGAATIKASDTKKKAATAPDEPKDTGPSKSELKQALARKVVEAIAALGLPDEDAAIVSQWTHHLPTGKDETGKRYWPASMPRPDRSDWR